MAPPKILSSASSGKTAAPKAPRRRAAPPTTTSQITNAPETNTSATDLTLPSPAPTQELPAPEIHTQDQHTLLQPESTQAQEAVEPATEESQTARTSTKLHHQSASSHAVESTTGQSQLDRPSAPIVERSVEPQRDAPSENLWAQESQPAQTIVDSATASEIPILSTPPATQHDFQNPAVAGQTIRSTELRPNGTSTEKAVTALATTTATASHETKLDASDANSQSTSQIASNVEMEQQYEDATQAKAGPATKGKNKRVRLEAPSSSKPRAAKRPRKSSARSNGTDQADINEDPQPEPSTSCLLASAEQVQPPVQLSGASKSKRAAARKSRSAPEKAKSAVTIVNSDDEDQAVQTTEAATESSRPMRTPKRRKRATNFPDAAQQPEEDMVLPEKPAPRKRKRAPKKAATEAGAADVGTEQTQEEPQEAQSAEDLEAEDLEAHEINPQTVSMWDLSYDTHHGKKSEMGKQMANIDWEEVAKKRRAEGESTGPANAQKEVAQSVEGADKAATSQNGESRESPAPAEGQGNIDFQLDAYGNIVEDATTLVVARDDGERQRAENAAVEEVNDLTVQINRTTWANKNRRDPIDQVPAWKWKSDPWSEEETDKFYEAISMWGTDFMTISLIFPPKTRRMIKAKFVREEKLDPQRINDALCGKIVSTMSLERYCQETGKDISLFTKFEGLEHAQREINESMRDRQEALTNTIEQEATLAAEEEAEKRKSRKKEGKKSRKKGPRGGAFGGIGGGGPDEEVQVE